MKNGAVAESGAQAGEYPNVDISKHILDSRETPTRSDSYELPLTGGISEVILGPQTRKSSPVPTIAPMLASSSQDVMIRVVLLSRFL